MSLIGFVNVKKPSGMTSHDVVNRLRKITKVKQVGHAGTLDPLAEGVLPVAIGQACRLIRFLPGDKTYLAKILLGQRTTTDDIEGDVIEKSDQPIPSIEVIRTTLAEFVGDIDQIPPAYSAIHVDGKRLYELARAGNLPAEIKPRAVRVHSIEVLSQTDQVVEARIACGAGTYIRSIARDLGDKLGMGGCLSGLQREKSGFFEINQAVSLEDLQSAQSENNLPQLVCDPVSVFEAVDNCMMVEVNDEVTKKLQFGQKIFLASIVEFADSLKREQAAKADYIACVNEGKLVAMCLLTEEEQLKPEVVMTHAV